MSLTALFGMSSRKSREQTPVGSNIHLMLSEGNSVRNFSTVASFDTSPDAVISQDIRNGKVGGDFKCLMSRPKVAGLVRAQFVKKILSQASIAGLSDF